MAITSAAVNADVLERLQDTTAWKQMEGERAKETEARRRELAKEYKRATTEYPKRLAEKAAVVTEMRGRVEEAEKALEAAKRDLWEAEREGGALGTEYDRVQRLTLAELWEVADPALTAAVERYWSRIRDLRWNQCSPNVGSRRVKDERGRWHSRYKSEELKRAQGIGARFFHEHVPGAEVTRLVAEGASGPKLYQRLAEMWEEWEVAIAEATTSDLEPTVAERVVKGAKRVLGIHDARRARSAPVEDDATAELV